MGYRKISYYLNEKGIKTARGNSWGNTQVFSVLKKYRLRQERSKNVRLKEHNFLYHIFVAFSFQKIVKHINQSLIDYL